MKLLIVLMILRSAAISKEYRVYSDHGTRYQGKCVEVFGGAIKCYDKYQKLLYVIKPSGVYNPDGTKRDVRIRSRQ